MSNKDLIITAIVAAMMLAGLVLFSIGQISCDYDVSDAGVIIGLLSLLPLWIESRIEERRAGQ